MMAPAFGLPQMVFSLCFYSQWHYLSFAQWHHCFLSAQSQLIDLYLRYFQSIITYYDQSDSCRLSKKKIFFLIFLRYVCLPSVSKRWRMNESLVSNITDIQLDYPILYCTEIFWNKIACIYITCHHFQNDLTLKVLPISVFREKVQNCRFWKWS